MTTTYVYQGPSTLAVIGLAVVVATVLAIVGRLLNRVEDWWDDRQAGPPGPVEEAVDSGPIEPAEGWPWPDGTVGVLHRGGWLPTGPVTPIEGETEHPTGDDTDVDWAALGEVPPPPLDVELDPELRRIARGIAVERFGG
jgi:hypothetical protein